MSRDPWALRSKCPPSLGQELDHADSLADAQSAGGATVHLFCRDLEAAQEALAEASLPLASAHEFRYFLAQATMQRGRALAEQGLSVLTEALAQVEKTDGRYYETELRRLKGGLLLIRSPSNRSAAPHSGGASGASAH